MFNDYLNTKTYLTGTFSHLIENENNTHTLVLKNAKILTDIFIIKEVNVNISKEFYTQLLKILNKQNPFFIITVQGILESDKDLINYYMNGVNCIFINNSSFIVTKYYLYAEWQQFTIDKLKNNTYEGSSNKEKLHSFYEDLISKSKSYFTVINRNNHTFPIFNSPIKLDLIQDFVLRNNMISEDKVIEIRNSIKTKKNKHYKFYKRISEVI